jgi:hypothetical protein
MPTTPKTLEELYCAAHKITPERFRKRAFWGCLHKRTILLVPAILVLDRGFFAPDRELISSVARSTTMKQVDDELRDFFADPQNLRWLRRHAKVRVSSRRILRFASAYLGPGDAPPVAGKIESEGAEPDSADPGRRRFRRMRLARQS